MDNSHSAAKDLVDKWERIEGESMRDGHRSTLERLIVELLEKTENDASWDELGPL